MRQPEEFGPFVPAGQAHKGIGTQQPGDGRGGPKLGTHLVQGVHRVGRRPPLRGAAHLAGIQQQPGEIGQGQFQHAGPLRGSGAGRGAMWRVCGRHQMHLRAERIACGAGNGQMAAMDRVEGAAVVEVELGAGIGKAQSGIDVGSGFGIGDLGFGKKRV